MKALSEVNIYIPILPASVRLIYFIFSYSLNFCFSYIFHYATNSVRICFPMLTTQIEFQILNLHHKKHIAISKIKEQFFLKVYVMAAISFCLLRARALPERGVEKEGLLFNDVLEF